MTRDDIRDQLFEVFSPQFVDVVDESDQHRGHGGTPHTHNTHFNVTIVSLAFHGASLVQRHRMVYDALHSAFSSTLHALRITAKTPDEWGP